jgi:hypothetical protein
MHKLIATFVDGKKLAEFFMFEETLFEEDMLEKLRYFEEVESWVLNLLRFFIILYIYIDNYSILNLTPHTILTLEEIIIF